MSADPPEPEKLPAAEVVPLDELARELGPLPGPLAAEYGRQAADLLRIVHDAGRAHGDIRPGTLLVGPVVVRPNPGGTSRRRPGAGATVSLADPGPDAGPGDPADDVRDLGAALYQLLAGRPPAPTPAPLGGVRPDLPPGFADAVHRMMGPDPAARPTAAEAAETLAGFARAVVATPIPDSAPGWAPDPFPSAAHATARPPRRPRTAGERTRIGVLVALGLVLNLAAVGLAVAWWSGGLDRKPEAPPEPGPGAGTATPAPKKGERGGYRYVRYLAPDDSWGNIAEFEVYGGAGGGKLTGRVIGTLGSWGDGGNTREKAFDGDPGTFFDAPESAGGGAWVGLDLGAAHAVTRVKFAPRAGYAGRMVGGRFQASPVSDFSSGVVDLYTITEDPPEGVLTARAVGSGAGRGRKPQAKPDPDTDLDGVRD